MKPHSHFACSTGKLEIERQLGFFPTTKTVGWRQICKIENFGPNFLGFAGLVHELLSMDVHGLLKARGHRGFDSWRFVHGRGRRGFDKRRFVHGPWFRGHVLNCVSALERSDVCTLRHGRHAKELPV
jgi:hypothetical protein